MSFQDFIDGAWTDHADHPEAVAARLAASTTLVTCAEEVAPFASLVVHVFGEHLGRWREGIELLDALHGHGDAAAEQAIGRSIVVLRHTSGDATALDALSVDDRAHALAIASSALAGRLEFRRAIEDYAQALQLAAPDALPRVARALAVGGNNLAAALEAKAERDAFETEGMVQAAEGALVYWKLAGTWLEEERALYRLACSLLKAGQPGPAAAQAARCIEVCEANDAPAFERFFGLAVLARAQRAGGDAQAFCASRERALALHAELPDDEKPWCATELQALREP